MEIKSHSIKMALCKFALYGAVSGLAIVGAWQGGKIASDAILAKYSEARAALVARFSRVEVREVSVPQRELNLTEAIKAAADHYRVPRLLLLAVATQESGAGLRYDRVRYEPKLQSRFKRAAWMNDAEYQALASSWGLGQVVYGLHKDFCGLNSYADLLRPETNLKCSARILSKCLERRAGSAAFRVRACLSEYNGDGTGRYADQVMSRLAELAVEQAL